MGPKQWIFDRFGYKPIGQAAAAIVIGALMGFGLSDKLPKINPLILTAGGACAGALAGLLLLAGEYSRKATTVGLSKSIGYWLLLLVLLGTVIIGATYFLDQI